MKPVVKAKLFRLGTPHSNTAESSPRQRSRVSDGSRHTMENPIEGVETLQAGRHACCRKLARLDLQASTH
jgi:hypothetical protein